MVQFKREEVSGDCVVFLSQKPIYCTIKNGYTMIKLMPFSTEIDFWN